MLNSIFISAEEVRETLTMASCIEAVDAAMRALSNGKVPAPPRSFVPVADSDAVLALMPGSTSELGVYGAKIMTLHPQNPAHGLPVLQGFIVLFDRASGALAAIVEGSSVTAIRTAAASALATRELAREDATSHGIFGTGVQAGTHIDAIAAVRPIERVAVWGRNFDTAAAFAAAQQERTGFEIVAVEDPRDAAGCDIVSTVTASADPVIHGDWVTTGAHVNLVGSHAATAREADTELIVRSRVYVDSLQSALSQAGELVIPIQEESIGEEHVVGEIGEVLEGRVAGRGDDAAITVYKSLGVVAQDLFAANRVFDELSRRCRTDVSG